MDWGVPDYMRNNNHSTMKTYVIIAAYNVEKTIGQVIDALRMHNYNNIVVINDCSKDKTEEIALRKGAIVLTHFINRGQGAALATGHEYALNHGADIIVDFDGDGQMMAEDINDMIRPIINKEADITIGSRFLGKKALNMPQSKKVTLFLGNLWLRLFYGVRLSDSQCGFRALSRKGAQSIEIKQDRAEHASEILIEIFKKHIKYKEVPVRIRYTSYSKEHTQHGKLHLISGIKIALKTIIKRLS